MKKNVLYFVTILVFIAVSHNTVAQSYDLQQLLKESKLITYNYPVVSLPDTEKKGISAKGVVYLKNSEFSNGTIDIDLRGKDVFQKSFLGIVFHGNDTVTFDCIYFRPFNFNATDSVRRIHAVQYVASPDFGWERLRKEHNGVYEKGIVPPPSATDWFHATIVIKGQDINVYVNNSKTPALAVRKLNDRATGQIGLFGWSPGLTGDFANLVIRKAK